MSQTVTACTNVRCSCDPCGCVECVCRVASLGALERRVIGVLWQDARSALSGREVADAMPDYAYTTIVTVLDRLEHKGLVRHTKVGRTNRFAATATSAAHAASVMHDAMVTAHVPSDALASFVRQLTHEHAAVVRRELDERGSR